MIHLPFLVVLLLFNEAAVYLQCHPIMPISLKECLSAQLLLRVYVCSSLRFADMATLRDIHFHLHTFNS